MRGKTNDKGKGKSMLVCSVVITKEQLLGRKKLYVGTMMVTQNVAAG